jgi:hypothetical protein
MIPTTIRSRRSLPIIEGIEMLEFKKILANMLIVNIGKQISNCKFIKKKIICIKTRRINKYQWHLKFWVHLDILKIIGH